MCSWSRWPREIAARFVRDAGLADDRELALSCLGAQHGRDFAADVLASLSADVAAVREGRPRAT